MCVSRALRVVCPDYTPLIDQAQAYTPPIAHLFSHFLRIVISRLIPTPYVERGRAYPKVLSHKGLRRLVITYTTLPPPVHSRVRPPTQ